VRGDQLRLGIAAPKDVPVHRSEVYQTIPQENQAAAASSGQPSTMGKTLDQLRDLPRAS